MSKFWKARIGMFIWGALCTYFFTRKIDITSKLFTSQVIGNTIIMWLAFKNK